LTFLTIIAIYFFKVVYFKKIFTQIILYAIDFPQYLNIAYIVNMQKRKTRKSTKRKLRRKSRRKLSRKFSRKFGYSHNQGPRLYASHMQDGILLSDDAFGAQWGNPEVRAENAGSG